VKRDLLPLGHPDACPVCGTDHRNPGPLPACGPHGHQLQHTASYRDRWVYSCPAHRCSVHITIPSQPPERPPPVTSQPAIHHPMTATPSTELAIRGDQQRFDKYQLAALRQKGIVDAPNAELAIFFHYCKTRGLDPFAHHATMVNYGGQWTIQTEIDGFRHLGHRAANAHGDVIAMPEPVYVDTDGNEHKHWVRNEPPGMVIVTILKNGAPFVGEANYFEFRKLHPRTGEPMGLWAKMPANQTRKCAEAQAWRMAYQSEFAAIPIELAIPAAAPATAPARVVSEECIDVLVASVAAGFDQLGVQSLEERLNLAAALAGRDPLEVEAISNLPLTTLEHIAAQLAQCADVAQLHALLDRGDAPAGDDPALD